MARTNVRVRGAKRTTYEGAPARSENPIAALQRVLNAHMLWEDKFYIEGVDHANQLALAVQEALRKDPTGTAQAIVAARTEMNIRHASLMAAVEYAVSFVEIEHGYEVRSGDRSPARLVLAQVIERADELAEVLALVAARKGAAKKMPHSVRKGVADAFTKFDEYQYGKYRGGGNEVTLRDAVFLTHPAEPKQLVDKIVGEKDQLATPDTWETALSGGADKKETFERLMSENRLGAMALLRNLRNMTSAGVDRKIVETAFEKANWSRVLPFRFVSAVKHAPDFTRMLAAAFEKAKAGQEALGKANIVLDVSGSMQATLSGRSTLTYAEAGRALAACWPGEARLFQFATEVREQPSFGGLADAIAPRLGHLGYGTMIGKAVAYANAKSPDADYTIVVTDCQSHDAVPEPTGRGVMINVAAYQHGVATQGKWLHLSGFSEHLFRYLRHTD